VLLRAGSKVPALAPGAAAGALLLVVALLFDQRGLGAALWLAGATYVEFLVVVHHGIDGSAPLVAVLLLLAGELTAWSADARGRLRVESRLIWRRAGAVGALAIAGIAVATAAVALSAVPPAHGLAWTLVGAAAAIGAAGAGIVLARR
jgi:hypothetical protein